MNSDVPPYNEQDGLPFFMAAGFGTDRERKLVVYSALKPMRAFPSLGCCVVNIDLNDIQ